MVNFLVAWVELEETEINKLSQLRLLNVSKRIVIGDLSKPCADEYCRILNIGAPNDGIYISVDISA